MSKTLHDALNEVFDRGREAGKLTDRPDADESEDVAGAWNDVEEWMAETRNRYLFAEAGVGRDIVEAYEEGFWAGIGGRPPSK